MLSFAMLILTWTVPFLTCMSLGRVFGMEETSETTEIAQIPQSPQEAAKLVEEYILAADFNNHPVAQLPYQGNQSQAYENVPRSNTTAHFEKIEALEPTSRIVDVHASKKLTNSMTESFSGPPPPINYPPTMTDFGVVYPQVYPDSASDRDALVSQNSVSLVVSQRSVLAIGFITFLILLSSLQSSVFNMIAANRISHSSASTSLLGGVTQALGRRRRSLDFPTAQI